MEQITYLTLGYNNLLQRSSPAFNIDDGINDGNADSIIDNASVDWNKINSGGDTPEAGATNNSAEIVNGILITDLVNARLNTSAKTILSDFTFGVSGAIVMATDVNNGLWLSPTGILGKKAGVTTFAVDTSGNATYAGTVTASQIVAGILTGFTIQTAVSPNKRVVMASDKIEIYNSANALVGKLEGLTGTWASGVQATIGEIDIIGMTAQGGGFTSITKDGVIGIDVDGMALSTNKTGGGMIKLIPETGQDVYSTEDINLASGKEYKINGTALSLGETNTASSAGGTYSWYKSKTGVNLDFRGFAVAGALSVTDNTTYWTLTATGEANTASTLGGTYGWYSSKSGSDLRFRGFSVGSGLSVTDNTTYWTLNHAVGTGYNHVPTSGTTYQMLRNSADGTVSWTSSLYVGGSSSYALYLNGSIITSTVGMYLNGNSVVNGTLSVVGEVNASNGSVHTSGNIYTGGYGSAGGSVSCALLYLAPAATNPSGGGTIRNYASGAVDQFRGVPGDGSWVGSFDMTAA